MLIHHLGNVPILTPLLLSFSLCRSLCSMARSCLLTHHSNSVGVWVRTWMCWGLWASTLVSSRLPRDSGSRCERPDPPLLPGFCPCSAARTQQLATFSRRRNWMWLHVLLWRAVVSSNARKPVTSGLEMHLIQLYMTRVHAFSAKV